MSNIIKIQHEKQTYKEFMPKVTITVDNNRTVALSPHAKELLEKMQEYYEYKSFNQTIHSLILENEMIRQIIKKMDFSLETALRKDRVGEYVLSFTDLADSIETIYLKMLQHMTLPQIELPKNIYFYRDFIPELIINDETKENIKLSRFVKSRLKGYKKRHNSRSFCHAIHTLVLENFLVLQIAKKLILSRDRGFKEDDPRYFTVIFRAIANTSEIHHIQCLRDGII